MDFGNGPSLDLQLNTKLLIGWFQNEQEESAASLLHCGELHEIPGLEWKC